MGNATVMDDSNVPNLIAAPYLGYCSEQEEDYLQTRRTLLSKENPYFYEGKYAKELILPYARKIRLADCISYGRNDNVRQI